MAEHLVSADRVWALLSEASVEAHELLIGCGDIPRIQGPPSPLEFLREFVAQNRPVIVQGAISHWPALGRWTNRHLAERIGGKIVTVDVTPSGRGDAPVTRDELRELRVGLAFESSAASEGALSECPRIERGEGGNVSNASNAGSSRDRSGTSDGSHGSKGCRRSDGSNGIDRSKGNNGSSAHPGGCSNGDHHDDDGQNADDEASSAKPHEGAADACQIKSEKDALPAASAALEGERVGSCWFATPFVRRQKFADFLTDLTKTRRRPERDMEGAAFGGGNSAATSTAAAAKADAAAGDDDGGDADADGDAVSEREQGHEQEVGDKQPASLAQLAPPYVPYVQHQNNSFVEEYAELAADVDLELPWASLAFGCSPEATNLWVGDERAVTSFHKDHYENIYAVVAGKKHFKLLPPVDVHRMYVTNHAPAQFHYSEDSSVCSLVLPSEPLPAVPWSSIDPLKAPDKAYRNKFERYFNGPPPLECTLSAGEVLYLPSMWFHHVMQTPDEEGRTIAINYWYNMNFGLNFSYYSLVDSLTKELVGQQYQGDETAG